MRRLPRICGAPDIERLRTLPSEDVAPIICERCAYNAFQGWEMRLVSQPSSLKTGSEAHLLRVVQLRCAPVRAWAIYWSRTHGTCQFKE